MRLCIYHFAVLDPFEGLLLISLLIFQGFNPILLLSGQTKGLVDSPAANWITVATSQHEALTILSRSFSSFTWASFATRIDTTNDVLRILGDKQGHWDHWMAMLTQLKYTTAAILLAPYQVRAPESSISTIVLNLHDVKMQMSRVLVLFSRQSGTSPEISAPTLIFSWPKCHEKSKCSKHSQRLFFEVMMLLPRPPSEVQVSPTAAARNLHAWSNHSAPCKALS